MNFALCKNGVIMRIDLTDKEWLQNRLIDLELLLIISILTVPIAGFSFIGETQEIHPVLPWPAIFGFIIPNLFIASLFGVIGLIHHRKEQWRYKNPIKASLIITLSVIFILFILGYILSTIFPNIDDCIISFYFNAKPCSALDIDGFRSTVLYVYYGIPSILILFIFLIIILNLSNRINQGRIGRRGANIKYRS